MASAILQISLSLAASSDFKYLDLRVAKIHVVDVFEPIALKLFFFGSQWKSRFDGVPDKPVLILLGSNDHFWIEIKESLVRHRPTRVKSDVLTGN